MLKSTRYVKANGKMILTKLISVAPKPTVFLREGNPRSTALWDKKGNRRFF